MGLAIFVAAIISLAFVRGLDNGLGLTPQMGKANMLIK